MSIYKTIVVATLCCISIGDVRSQPGPTTTDPNGGAKPGAAPISGIEILIGLGGLFGAKKLFDARKKNS